MFFPAESGENVIEKPIIFELNMNDSSDSFRLEVTAGELG